MKHASVVVTAEPIAPLYPSEQAALAAVGNKRGSGNSPTWAIWITRGKDFAELIASGIDTLSNANEQAREIAEFLRDGVGRDEWEELRAKVTRQ